jgi:hypothetical protein
MIVLVMRLIGPSQKKVLNGHMAEVLTSRPAGLGSMLISDENPISQVLHVPRGDRLRCGEWRVGYVAGHRATLAPADLTWFRLSKVRDDAL